MNFRQHNTQQSTKLKVYREVVLISLLYRHKTWTLYIRHLKQLGWFHMHSLRSVYQAESSRKIRIEQLQSHNFQSLASMDWTHHQNKQLQDPETAALQWALAGQTKSVKADLANTFTTLEGQCFPLNMPPKLLKEMGKDRSGWYILT